MLNEIALLHLRTSSGSGGGPEKTILKSGQLINRARFRQLIVYLKKNESDLFPVAYEAKKANLCYYEIPGRKYFDPAQFWKIIKLIKNNKVRILHCHDPKTDFYGILLKPCFPGLRLVSTIHGRIYRSGKSKLYNLLDKFILRFYHAVIAVSKDIEQKAIQHGIKRPILIRNAIDTNEWHPNHPSAPGLIKPKRPGSFLIGYVGRISAEKGPLDFVRTAHKVLQQDKFCEFIIAGEGPQKESMMNLADELGVMGYFHFIGQIKRSDIFSIYQKLDLMLITSHTEGMPNTLLEACAMCVPVVSTRVGGVTEVLTNDYNGLLADVSDIKSLATNIIKIKNDRGFADRLKENGRMIIEKQFSFKEFIKKTEELYSHILNN